LLYFEPAPGKYVRPIYKTVPFDPGPTPEQWKSDLERRRNPQPTQAGAPRGAGQQGEGASNPNRVNNGVSSDPHMSSKELGKIMADITVGNTIAEIKRQMAEKRGSKGQEN
jgi:hypothetical protein